MTLSISSILPTILSYLLVYKYYALFGFAALAAFGIPLPLDMVTVAVGAFVGQGYFDFYLTLLVILMGNVLGDCTDYFLARSYEKNVMHEKYIRKYSFFTRIESYLEKYTALTIIFSRFVGALSVPTSILSGYTKIPFRKFLLYDVIGNMLTSLTLLAIGYEASDYWENVSGFVSLSEWVIGLGIIIFAVYTIYFSKNHK